MYNSLEAPGVGPITFRNATFLAAFSQSFLSFVISMDPNDKLDSMADITPPWTTFPDGNIEMIFNKTADNQTDIHPIVRDSEFLERCR